MDALTAIKDIFTSARTEGGINYIFTLLRLCGLSYGQRDPLLVLRDKLNYQDKEDLDGNKHISKYQLLLSESKEPFSLLFNILNCIKHQPFNTYPWEYLNNEKNNISLIASELTKKANEVGKSDLAILINEAYPIELLDSLTLDKTVLKPEIIEDIYNKCQVFLLALLKVYFDERISFKDKQRYYKLPRFEVLELLIDEQFGLYGMRVHFSNGNNAYFARTPDSTEAVNLITDEVPIGFMIGFTNGLKQEWRVGNKRLYEIGLPGCYNKTGEWKPIIYPGDASPLIAEAIKYSDDPEVQGAYFYLLSTSHRVVEFAVKTAIHLPCELINLGDRFHLWQCPRLNQQHPYEENIFIYDGWWDLEQTDPDYLKYVITSIRVGVNRIAFFFEAKVEWRLKYLMTEQGGSCATPDENDLKILDETFKYFPKTDDSIVLDAAIDWYNRGSTTRNVFNKFLCFYIALESVCTAIADGDADFGLGYRHKDKKERKIERIECIKIKYNQLYATDPIEFVEKAYFDCVLSLKEKVHSVTEIVFGQGHPYINTLFEKGEDGYSLNGIRGQLAHGRKTLLFKQEEILVRKRLNEIKRIAYEFIMRLTFQLKPIDPLPTWSQKHASTMSAADPRSLLVINREDALPSKDWRIRPEWIE